MIKMSIKRLNSFIDVKSPLYVSNLDELLDELLEITIFSTALEGLITIRNISSSMISCFHEVI